MELKKYTSGIIFVATIAIFVNYIQSFSVIKNLGISSVIIAIILGVSIKNTFGTKQKFHAGIKFCSKKILRLAIVLLGFKLSIIDVSKLGTESIMMIGIITIATLFFTKYLGKKLGVSRNLAILIGAGSSICGAAAVAATSSVIKTDNEEEASLAVGLVTIFGTLFMIIYPIVFNLFHLGVDFYSMWVGTSIHEVAQVTAAGFLISQQAGISATIVKLTRVLLIIPITVILSIKESNKNKDENFSLKNITIPWFVFFFLAAIAINSTGLLTNSLSKSLINIDGYLMTIAMVALGLETSFGGIKRIGAKPIYLGAAASLFISIFSVIVIQIFKLI